MSQRLGAALSLITEADAKLWPKVERILRPETESEAAQTAEFRRMIRADVEAWGAYLKALAKDEADRAKIAPPFKKGRR
ncbi:MAG: hypothetical protein R3C54_05795 [Parvularculaceae bacterium]